MRGSRVKFLNEVKNNPLVLAMMRNVYGDLTYDMTPSIRWRSLKRAWTKNLLNKKEIIRECHK